MDRSRRWTHTRLLGGPWLACAVVVPVVLAVVATLTGRTATEDDLTTRTRDALAAAGVDQADVSFDGVVGTVVVRLRALPDGMSSREVQAAVDHVAGARSVSVEVPRRPGLAGRGGTPAVTTWSPTAEVTPTSPTSQSTSWSPTATSADCTAPQAAVDDVLGPDRVAFGNAGAVLPTDQRAEVETVAAYLVSCGLAVDVVGHTADRAPAASRVGIDRAAAVAEVLRAAGVSVVRVQGRRDSSPLGDNDTQAGRLLNRYADVVVR